MTGRVGRKANGGNSVRGVVVDGFDLGEGGKVLGFRVECGPLIG